MESRAILKHLTWAVTNGSALNTIYYLCTPANCSLPAILESYANPHPEPKPDPVLDA